MGDLDLFAVSCFGNPTGLASSSIWLDMEMLPIILVDVTEDWSPSSIISLALALVISLEQVK